jgi:phosphoserine phosphatase
VPDRPDFIETVLRLQLRLAVFDCDGTLWAGDAGEGFFDWELNQRLVSDEIARWARPRYAAYKAGKVSEEDMCGEMVTMHRGLTETEVQRAAHRYFEQNFTGQIFPEMRDLVQRLQKAGCDVWAVSSTNEWVIRASMRYVGIPEEKVLAAAVRVVDGIVTDRLLRVPSGEGKPRAIHDAIGRPPEAAFGNSIWDAAMLEISRHPFVINPTPELEKVARQRKWPVHRPNLGPS